MGLFIQGYPNTNKKSWKELTFPFTFDPPKSEGVTTPSVAVGFADVEGCAYYLWTPNPEPAQVLPFQFEIPHDYVLGSPLMVHVHFSTIYSDEVLQEAAAVNIGVEFAQSTVLQVCSEEYKSFRSASVSLASCPIVWGSAWYHHKTASEELISFDSHSAIVKGVCYRRADSYGAPVVPLSIDLHYYGRRDGTKLERSAT